MARLCVTFARAQHQVRGSRNSRYGTWASPLASAWGGNHVRVLSCGGFRVAEPASRSQVNVCNHAAAVYLDWMALSDRSNFTNP